MLRCPSIPLLPGMVYHDVTKTSFHKCRPPLPGTRHNSPDGPPYDLPSLYPPYEGPKMPPWLKYDKKVLRFYGYFKETLEEVYKSPYQVRKVVILFYLEDGTMQISEPRTRNSGLNQGCIVSRKRVPRPPPCQNEFISVLDLNVNRPLRMFDRVYHITDCDLFTRHFLNRAGISVPDAVETPEDPGQKERAREQLTMLPKKPKTQNIDMRKFLENDKKVLRFYAYWDDRDSQFGDFRDLIVYYFLSDDTIEINEKFPVNSGRDAPPVLLKRMKLPKLLKEMPGIGESCPLSVLNVLGSNIRNGRFVYDRLNVGDKAIEYYTEKDLTIGSVINAFGRSIVLVDADLFTKEYYRKKYGLEDFTPIPKPVDNFSTSVEMEERVLPVFNGWGTHEDSEQNCITVEPKAPQFDFKKFYKHDGQILRFGAKLLDDVHPENMDRIFTICYYLMDDTIGIYEFAYRNSGFIGGEFFKRSKFYLPGEEWYQSGRPRSFQSQHFYIGATVVLRDFKFHIVTADEWALKYMEDNSQEYPKANINLIIGKVKEALKNGYQEFICMYLNKICSNVIDGKCVQTICFDTLRNMCLDLLGNNIDEHEIITMARYFSAIPKDKMICDREEVRSILHTEFKRNLWNGMDRLREHIYHLDPLNRGFMSENKLRSTILSNRIPIKPELLTKVFKVLNKNECCEIEVCDFLHFLDYTGCKSAPSPPTNIYLYLCPKLPNKDIGRLIDWNCFIHHVGWEDELKRQ